MGKRGPKPGQIWSKSDGELTALHSACGGSWVALAQRLGVSPMTMRRRRAISPSLPPEIRRPPIVRGFPCVSGKSPDCRILVKRPAVEGRHVCYPCKIAEGGRPLKLSAARRRQISENQIGRRHSFVSRRKMSETRRARLRVGPLWERSKDELWELWEANGRNWGNVAAALGPEVKRHQVYYRMNARDGGAE